MTELTYALCVVTANLLAILAFLVFPLDPSVLAVRRARVVPVSRALLGYLGSRLVPLNIDFFMVGNQRDLKFFFFLGILHNNIG